MDLETAEGIEQHAVIALVEQAALLELALHLDQQIADRSEQADGDRLIVDVSAAAPICAQRAAQNQQVLLDQEILLFQMFEDGVVARQLE